MIIDLIVNIILDYLKKTFHNVFTIAKNIQGVVLFCKRSPLKLLNKILEKIPQGNFIFSKVTGPKNEFIHIFFNAFAKNLNNFVHDFWENSFRKPKLLLAANRLIYLNISIFEYIKNSRSPVPSHTIAFYIK